MSDKINELTDALMLTFQSLNENTETTHTELYKLCVKRRVTSGRDFRRQMRIIRDVAIKASKLSADIEKLLREEKENKNAS